MHLYVESKKAKLTEVDSKLMIARDWGQGVREMKRRWSKSANFQLYGK